MQRVLRQLPGRDDELRADDREAGLRTSWELRADEGDGCVALPEVGRPLRWRVKAGVVAAAAAFGLAGLALAMDPWHRGAATVGSSPQQQGQRGTELLHQSLNSNIDDMGTMLMQPFQQGDFEIYVEDSSIFTAGDDIVILNTGDKGSDNEEAVVKSVGEGKLTLVDALTQSLPAQSYVILPADPVSGEGSHYHPHHDQPTTTVYVHHQLPGQPSTPINEKPEKPRTGVHPAIMALVVLFVIIPLLCLCLVVQPLLLYTWYYKETPRISDEGTQWMFKPRDNRPVMVLSAPDLTAEESGQYLYPGERFRVVDVVGTQPPEVADNSQTVKSEDRVGVQPQEAEGGPSDSVFLELADGRGWVVDREPGQDLCYQLFADVDQIWMYQPQHAGQLPVLQGPDLEGPRTDFRLYPGEKFYVSEIQAFADGGTLFLRLADGRGWVYDQAVSERLWCKRIVEETWAYQTTNYEATHGKPLRVRKSPDINGDKAPHTVQPGEQFVVDEIKEAEDDSGILYLKLADGRGWVFDSHPEYGALCDRI